MADQKISELTELTTPADDDVLAIVDTSSTETKKITQSNVSTAVRGDIVAADIPNLNASKITAGELADARIPNLATGKITSGTFVDARIPSLAADKITSGTFAEARIPNLAASKITSGVFDNSRLSTDTPTDGQILSWQSSDDTMQWIDSPSSNQFANQQALEDFITSKADFITDLGITSTVTELNILDGVTATTDELNILDGVKSTTAELNILDGVTATATEINALDGVTGTIVTSDGSGVDGTPTDNQIIAWDNENSRLYWKADGGGGGGTDNTIASSLSDVLSIDSSQVISSVDPGADRHVVWDESADKLTYFTASESRTSLGLGAIATLDTINTTHINGSALAVTSESSATPNDTTIPTTGWVNAQSYFPSAGGKLTGNLEIEKSLPIIDLDQTASNPGTIGGIRGMVGGADRGSIILERYDNGASYRWLIDAAQTSNVLVIDSDTNEGDGIRIGATNANLLQNSGVGKLNDIPSLPTGDGTTQKKVLQTTGSSGSETYSWVDEPSGFDGTYSGDATFTLTSGSDEFSIVRGSTTAVDFISDNVRPVIEFKNNGTNSATSLALMDFDHGTLHRGRLWMYRGTGDYAFRVGVGSSASSGNDMIVTTSGLRLGGLTNNLLDNAGIGKLNTIPTLPSGIDSDTVTNYNLRLTDVDGTETLTWAADTGGGSTPGAGVITLAAGTNVSITESDNTFDVNQSSNQTITFNATDTNTQLSDAEVITAIVNSTSITDANKTTIRSNIGAGTSDLVLGTSATTALAGNTTTITTAQANQINFNDISAYATGTAYTNGQKITRGNILYEITADITAAANTAFDQLTTTTLLDGTVGSGGTDQFADQQALEDFITNKADFRSDIGAGTSNLELGTSATTALAGNTDVTSWDGDYTGDVTITNSADNDALNIVGVTAEPTAKINLIGLGPSTDDLGIIDTFYGANVRGRLWTDRNGGSYVYRIGVGTGASSGTDLVIEDSGAGIRISSLTGNLLNNAGIGKLNDIPTLPTGDGTTFTRVLQTTGSSGSETYSWVAETSGGGGTDNTLNANITDVLSLSSQEISAVDAGSADAVVGWDDSASKLTYLSAADARAAIGAGTSDFDGAFSSLTGTPTTISGYGITDALQLGTSATTALAGNTDVTDWDGERAGSATITSSSDTDALAFVRGSTSMTATSNNSRVLLEFKNAGSNSDNALGTIEFDHGTFSPRASIEAQRNSGNYLLRFGVGSTASSLNNFIIESSGVRIGGTSNNELTNDGIGKLNDIPALPTGDGTTQKSVLQTTGSSGSETYTWVDESSGSTPGDGVITIAAGTGLTITETDNTFDVNQTSNQTITLNSSITQGILEGDTTVTPTGTWTWQGSGNIFPTFENTAISRIDMIKTGSISDGNIVAEIEMGHHTDDDTEHIYGQLQVVAANAADSEEDGTLNLGVLVNGTFDEDFISLKGVENRTEITTATRLSGIGATTGDVIIGTNATGDLSPLSATEGRTALGLGALATHTSVTTSIFADSTLAVSSELSVDSDTTMPTTSWVKDQGYITSSYTGSLTGQLTFNPDSGNTAPYFAQNGLRVGGNNTANEFDDYEEGTWSPTASNFTATDSSTDFVNKSATYVKIGRLVSCYGKVGVPANTDTSTLYIASLPFTKVEGRGEGRILAYVPGNTNTSDYAFSNQVNYNLTSAGAAMLAENTNDNDYADFSGGTIFFYFTYYTAL